MERRQESFIGVDIGRTKIAAGVINHAMEILDHKEVASPAHGDQKAVADIAITLVHDLEESMDTTLGGIGVGTPEVVSWPSGEVLQGDHNFALRHYFEKKLEKPVIVDSDANVAAWAEYRHGAALGASSAIVLTVGTGLGGGFIFADSLYRGSSGFAGEVGHILVSPEGGRVCVCGGAGCLETLASGTAIELLGREAAKNDPSGMIAAQTGGNGLVSGQTVFSCATAGDSAAIEIFANIGYWLGVGIASFINILDPDVVVIGGGLARAEQLILDPAIKSAVAHCPVRSGKVPPIRLAHHREKAGIIGAALLAKDELNPTTI